MKTEYDKDDLFTWKDVLFGWGFCIFLAFFGFVLIFKFEDSSFRSVRLLPYNLLTASAVFFVLMCWRMFIMVRKSKEK